MVSISVSRTGTFLGLGVSQGGTPKDPEKTRWVDLDFYRRKDGVLPRGPRGGFDLFRPRGVIGRGPQGP